ncbi:hypothetical protein Tco_0745951 [Tanacetum coccineum]
MEEEIQRAMAEAKSTKQIDWNDPSVISGKEDVATQKEMNDFSKETGAKRKKSRPRKMHNYGLETMLVLTENFMYYQVFRGDGSSKNYKTIVKKRYSASRLEGYDLMRWEDLYTLFESDEEDEIWKNQHEYNLISWRLCDFCGIHILLMENGLAIHMLIEKKYPLSQELFSKMLRKKLEVDHESSQAIELLRFIRSQVQK